VLRSLTSIIAEAQRRGQVAQNVAQAVKVKRSARERAKITTPPKKALKALLKAAQASDDRRAAPLVMLAVFAGLRASELRGLAWRQLDLSGHAVTVDQRADAGGNIGPPKSVASRRTTPLPASTIKALKEWKLACPPSEIDLVFPSLAGKAMSHRYMSLKVLRPPLTGAGVGGITLHDLRHAAASLWIEQRVEPKRVQTWLGHHSIQVTFDTYGHLFEAAERDTNVVQAIQDELLGSEGGR
jgi:integrase